MQIVPFKNVNRNFELALPDFDSLDECVAFVLAKIEYFSKDLEQEEYFVAKRWLEVKEADDFEEVILHIFNEGGEYLVSIDGNIHKGNWRYLPENGSMITEFLGKSELYDLSFLNEDFFILHKHGNQTYKGQRRYLVLGHEQKIRDLDWKTVMERMYNIYRSSSQMLLLVIIGIVIIAVIVFFNFF